MRETVSKSLKKSKRIREAYHKSGDLSKQKSGNNQKIIENPVYGFLSMAHRRSNVCLYVWL